MRPGTRFAQWSATDHSAWLWIVTILSMVYAFLVLGIRALVKWRMPGFDDAVLAVAYIFGVAQWSVMFSALLHGLGKAVTSVSRPSMAYAAKLVFTSRILFLVTASLSKCSVLLFLRQLFTDKSKMAWRLCTGMSVLVMVWAVASSLLVSLGCSPTQTLDSLEMRRCTHSGRRVKAVTAIEFILEIILAALPVYLFSSLQMSIRNKIIVSTAFTFRLIDAGLFIAFLQSYLDFLSGAPNLDIASNLSWQQVIISWSLMSATIPCLKGFLGRFRTDDLLVLREGSYYGQHSSATASRSAGRRSYALGSMKASAHRQSGALESGTGFGRDDDQDHLRLSQTRLQNNHDNVEFTAHAYAHRATAEELSLNSDGSEQMIIRRKVEVNIQHEPYTLHGEGASR